MIMKKITKKSIKQITALSLVAGISAMAMCACSINIGNDAKPSSSSDADVSQTSTMQGTTENTTSENAVENDVTDFKQNEQDADILSFSFNLDGVDYTLPCDFSEFEKIGYSFEKDDKLNGNTYTIGVHPKKDGKSLDAEMWNPTDSPKKYSECKVGSIRIHLYDEHEIILPGGLKFDETVTVDVVKKKYGEPESTTEGDGYTVLQYEKDIYESVEFFIYTKEDMIKNNSVEFKNFS